MKSRRYSLDWILLSTAAIAFLFGRFISPRYEELLLESGAVETVTPLSIYSLIFSAVLLLGLLALWIYRWKSRKRK